MPLLPTLTDELPPLPEFVLPPGGEEEVFVFVLRAESTEAPPPPAPALAEDRPPAPEPAVAVDVAVAPMSEEGTPPPSVPEDVFPSLAELDAILAAAAEVPSVPDAATRAEIVAMLGLDPSVAQDPDLFLATLASLPPPEPDLLPGEEFSGPAGLAGASQPAAQDWHLG